MKEEFPPTATCLLRAIPGVELTASDEGTSLYVIPFSIESNSIPRVTPRAARSRATPTPRAALTREGLVWLSQLP